MDLKITAARRKREIIMITKLLSYAETAEILGISIISVKRCVGKGLLPTVRFSKRLVKIPLDKLEKLIEAGGLDVSEKTA